MDSKFGVGDKVEVINFGHPIMSRKEFVGENEVVLKEDGDTVWVDMNPEIVGKQGIICTVSKTQGQYQYAINGIEGKHTWYNEGQLKMIQQNQNNL